MKYLYKKHRFIRHLPVYPVIYPAALFIFLLDAWVEIYHRITFPIYGIPYIKRKNYIKIDRHKLKYLNPMQKLNCVYCGYANGVLQYISKIIAETETYWCAIQHEKNEQFLPPDHHEEFIKYGDKRSYTDIYESKKTRML
jgi:hypothetical protein